MTEENKKNAKALEESLILLGQLCTLADKISSEDIINVALPKDTKQKLKEQLSLVH